MVVGLEKIVVDGCITEFVTDDITVRFYEQDDEGNVKWEDYGNFANHDVHRQVLSYLYVAKQLCSSLDTDKVKQICPL